MRYERLPRFLNGSKGIQEFFDERSFANVLAQIFIRAFDLDERLVGVAFLDVGVYVTTLRSLKNLLLIGDAVHSVWLAAFQVRGPALRVDAVPEVTAGGSLQTRHTRQGHPPGLYN